MAISIQYPTMVELDDGSTLHLSEETWKKRMLVVETDRSENAVRKIFKIENFVEAKFGEEIVKEGQMGSGLIKKFDIWQLHVRLFQHKKHIALDAEAEVANDQGMEHLTHGWISAFMETLKIIRKHFYRFWVYHRGVKKYVRKILKQKYNSLKKPKTKTDLKWIGGALFVGILAGTAIGASISKK